MHEVSIVRSIIKTLEQEFEEEKMNRMKAIHIKVGILSNIEPRLLQNAYEAQSLFESKVSKHTVAFGTYTFKNPMRNL